MSLVFVDIESSDLDERTGALLEVALVVTDDNLVEQAHNSIVIRHDPVPKMPPVVEAMHTANGLIAEITRGTVIDIAERALMAWVAAVVGINGAKSTPLCGSSVSFDRRWLRHHMSNLDGMFSHRSVDASTLVELAKRWQPAIYEGRPKSEKENHRALGDCRTSIAYLQYFREKGFVGGGAA